MTDPKPPVVREWDWIARILDDVRQNYVVRYPNPSLHDEQARAIWDHLAELRSRPTREEYRVSEETGRKLFRAAQELTGMLDDAQAKLAASEAKFIALDVAYNRLLNARAASEAERERLRKVLERGSHPYHGGLSEEACVAALAGKAPTDGNYNEAPSC